MKNKLIVFITVLSISLPGCSVKSGHKTQQTSPIKGEIEGSTARPIERDSAHIDIEPIEKKPIKKQNQTSISPCKVEVGSLRSSLKRIASEYERNLVWMLQGDLNIELYTKIKASSFRECVSLIVTAFQEQGADIQSVERDNAILIKGR